MKKVNKTGYKYNGEKVEVMYEDDKYYWVYTYYTVVNQGFHEPDEYLEEKYEGTLSRFSKTDISFEKPRKVLAEKVAGLIAEKDRLTAELRQLQNGVIQSEKRLGDLRKQIADRENWRVDWSELKKADSIIIFEEGRLLPEVFERKDLYRLRFYVQGKIKQSYDDKDTFIFNVYQNDTYGYNQRCDAILTNLSEEDVKKATAERIKDKGGVLKIIGTNVKGKTEAGLKQLLEYCLPEEKELIEAELEARKQKAINEAEQTKKAAEERLKKLLG